MKVTSLNEFQLACRQLPDRVTKTDPERLMTQYALGLVGQGAQVMELIEALDPRYRAYAGDLLKAAGALAEAVQKNVFHKNENESEIQRRIFGHLGKMLTEIALFADVIRTPMAQIASAALKDVK